MVADLDVLIDAPVAMTAAGCAELLAKVPAGADWIVAEALEVEPIDARAWPVVQEPLRDATRHPVAG